MNNDLISRQAAVDIAKDLIITINGYEQHNQAVNNYSAKIMQLQPAQPEQHIDADGTLWITVPDIKQVKRVIVDEEKSKFCRQFYLEEEQRTGKWILDRSGAYCCSECLEPCAGYVMMKPRDKFCKMCGARMTEGDSE